MTAFWTRNQPPAGLPPGAALLLADADMIMVSNPIPLAPAARDTRPRGPPPGLFIFPACRAAAPPASARPGRPGPLRRAGRGAEAPRGRGLADVSFAAS